MQKTAKTGWKGWTKVFQAIPLLIFILPNKSENEMHIEFDVAIGD